MLVEVAVGAPVRGTFTYEAGDPSALAPGRRLVVPFGRRRAIGVSLGPASGAPAGPLRQVEEVLDEVPVFSEDLLALLRFAADYYLYPLGEALRSALPPDLGKLPRAGRQRAPIPLAVAAVEPIRGEGLRSKRQEAILAHLAAAGGKATLDSLRPLGQGIPALLRTMEERGLVRLIYDEEEREEDPFSAKEPHRLSAPQGAAVDAILSSEGKYETFLLRGVTGSGKTEVYLRTIARVLESGRGALVLVPEIALTPQLAGRFRSRFGHRVAVLHSAMSDKERTEEHRRLLHGEASIALGARSVVFAPVRDLGVIVVDEEHDASFKQEEKLRYHARDLAVVRARLLGIPCVLGSATPSLESFENARTGKYRLLELPERIDGGSLPPVQIVDLRNPPSTQANEEVRILGDEVVEALRDVLQRGEQAILFLNRRGHAPLVLCPTCGESASCTRCDVGLTYHRSREELRCHTCDLRVPAFRHCPSCKTELLILGAGTERLEAHLGRLFPAARVARLDRDVASDGAKVAKTLSTFARREADVLVGTQMIAKGHDFPGVTLVGVVLADIGLGVPDFRAGERVFQLLTQVGGRAGRGRDPGRVIVQTFRPDSEPVAFASRHDYLGFSERELARRRQLGYPPFRRMLAVRAEAVDPAKAERLLSRLARKARDAASPETSILGPAPAPLARLRGMSRFQLLILARRSSQLQSLGRLLLEETQRAPGGVKVVFDVDPQSML